MGRRVGVWLLLIGAWGCGDSALPPAGGQPPEIGCNAPALSPGIVTAQCDDVSLPCDANEACVVLDGGDALCIENHDCDDVTNAGCEWPLSECVALPGGTRTCWEPTETLCTGHVWYEMVHDGEGTHHDFGAGRFCIPEHPEGPDCQPVPHDDDVWLECTPTRTGGVRRSPGWSFDLMALDFPIHAPRGMARCLVAWGVHPLRMIDRQVLGNTNITVTGTSIGAIGVDLDPLSAAGLSTRLPAAAFQHARLARPPQTAIAIPQTKAERGATIFWDDPSMTARKTQPLEQPYQTCNDCVTHQDLIEHLYPGPEIFAQGLSRDPADSMFVVPIYLPFHEQRLGTNQLTVMAEMVCQAIDGKIHRTTQVLAAAYQYPSAYPTTYPAPTPQTQPPVLPGVEPPGVEPPVTPNEPECVYDDDRGPVHIVE